MATYTIAGYDVNDVVIHSGQDPFEDDDTGRSGAVGTIFSVTSNPDVFDIEDNDSFFSDGDGSQDLSQSLSQGDGTASAGSGITPEYQYRVRPVGGTAADDFYIYHYDAGVSGNGFGFATEYRLVPGQQYQIMEEGPTNDPSVAYSSLYVCFTPGTMIATPSGARPIEKLGPGDLVRTIEGTCVPVLWVGNRELRLDDMAGHPEVMPVRFEVGSLGENLPERPLEVSPQHRIMLKSRVAERMFGEEEVLVPAHWFVGLPGITRVRGIRPTEYIHLLVEGHQVLLANGAPAESLYVGKKARQLVARQVRNSKRGLIELSPRPERPALRLVVA
ncbi:Hint domain-containing protein [Pseudooceanicola sp.]|uniref:Hint domain-containing protein n=1 Tax=Pseudooceanicola sp. TaxID=1914328 RepID=UPI0035C67DB5